MAVLAIKKHEIGPRVFPLPEAKNIYF